MIKKLFTYMTLLLAMTACSVDEFDAPSGFGPDGEVTVNLAVPEMETVKTRADENAVSDILMLVLSDQGVEEVLPFSLDDDEFSVNGTQYQIRTKLDQNLRVKSGLKFYFIANAPASVAAADLKTLPEASLMALETEDLLNGEKMTMAGSISLDALQKNGVVGLRRNAAKVTVTDGSKGADGKWTPGTTIYPVEVYSTAEKSSLVAGVFLNTDYTEAATAAGSIAFEGKDAAYVHRTLNPGRDNQVRPFMIVKAPFEGTDYYYRLEFETYDEATKKFNKLDLLSNHHYQVIVEEVLGKGDATAAAASKNPTSLIKATVYDYSPESYNMITDGIRELGVSAQLVHNGAPTTSATPEYLYVKVYSPEEDELTNAPANIKLSSPANWLSFGEIAVYDEDEANGTPIPGVEGNYKGLILRVPVSFNRTLDPGELTTTITVIWKGLSREVPVTWTREFDASELCTAELIIRDNTNAVKFQTGTTSTDNYWTFIKNNTKIDGLSVEQNNGKVRNEGLHFPVNYGGQSARWTYTYNLKFNNLNSGNPYDWRVSAEGLTGINISKTSGTNVTGTADFTVTQDGSVANWNYEVGTLRFEISKPGEDNWTSYEIDLYHTGFFDNPALFRETSTRHRVDKTESNFFYYYEVVEGPAGKYYWLDRNLGATSAEYYIESVIGSSEMTYYGRSNEARGGYYRAAKYNNGSNPEMYSDLCPPGFEVPRTEVWNTLRNNPNFITSRTGNYYQTYFTNTEGQTVYFPRGRHYNGNIKEGESRAGYYWTGTQADGLEKDHIGNWLKYLKFSGNIASYDNAEVEGRNNAPGWAMSVRCVNITTPSNTYFRTYFNVQGATHVFLYSLDENGAKNAVTNWPGKAIGNYITMGNEAGTGSGKQNFAFSYESPTTNPEDYYVIFTFRDKDGIWHTMSKGENGGTIYGTTNRLSELSGWKIIGDVIDGVPTTLGGTWVCNYQPGGGSAKVKFEAATEEVIQPDPVPDMLTIYFRTKASYTNVKVYSWSGNGDSANDYGHPWPGQNMTKVSEGLWTATIDKRCTGIKFSGTGFETSDLTVVPEDNHTYEYDLDTPTPPTPGNIDAIYLRGEVNGWNISDTYKFSSTDNETFTLTVANMTTGTFKISGPESDWTGLNLGGGVTGITDGTINLYNGGGDMTLAQGGNVTFTLKRNGGNWTLTIKHNQSIQTKHK